MPKSMIRVAVVGLALVLGFLWLDPTYYSRIVYASSFTYANEQDATTAQDAQSFYNELRIIYLTNLKRREAGLPPLRWNLQLQNAARWFAAEASSRTTPFCGHEDLQGRNPGDRFAAFGYRNLHAWGENVVCGITRPENAVTGWMNSPGHRQNILHPLYREIGVGYGQDATTGRGYISQEFSYDPNYAPVIIENEAIAVTTPQVNLYIYDTAGGNGLEAMGPATAMMIANQPDFAGAVWEAYSAEKSWTLEAGEGWRTVYVKVRDAQGRTSFVSDTIYLGANLTISDEMLNQNQPCTFNDPIVFRQFEQPGWPQVQLSVNWQGDNSDLTFEDLASIGTRIDDGDAIGGNAHHLPAGSSGDVRYWTTNFYKNVPLVAYFRIKAGTVDPAATVAILSIKGGGVEHGPITLTGANFTTVGQYQEFALPFTFQENADDSYLILNLHHTGATDVSFDTISLYTAAMPATAQIDWQVLGGYHRSRGVWARFINDAGTFSPPSEINLFDTTQRTTPPATLVPTPTPSPTPTPTRIPNEQLTHKVFLPITVR